MALATVFSSYFTPHGYLTMRCLSCDCNLSDREANRKYDNWQEIKNPESRYIMLCDDCMLDTDLAFVDNPNLSDEDYESDNEFSLEEIEE